ncbi:MAG: hypothetical protein LQ351_002515 [Letrouitia transgressa]|nr:MAG: hypothetical protein LQ351_002515 [Letrouitia transgressa]
MDPPKISFAASIGTSLESFKPTDLPHPSPDSAPSCPVSDSSSYHEQEEELKVAKFPEEDKASNPTRAPSPTSQEPFSFTLQTDHSTLPDLIRKELHPLQLSHPVPYSSMAESSSAKRAKRTDSTAIPPPNAPIAPSSKPLTSSSALAAKSTTQQKSEEMDLDSDPEIKVMRRLMGFATFKSTKNTKIPGNNVYGVRKEKKTEYRQYMNRVGGFNRPLSPSR